MKKKVLFALIALFSFVSSWADGPVATIGTTEYATLQEAFAAAAAATEDVKITLTGDLNLGDPQVAANRLELEDLGANAVTLDLGGFTLTGRINLRKGNLTVQNGNVFASNQPLNVYGSKVSTDKNYSVLTVADDVVITVTGTGTSLTDDQSNGVCMMSSQTAGVWDKVCYGAVINFYGEVKHGTADVDMSSGLIFVHGWIIGGSANNVVNIKDGSVINSKNAGIALNGIATVNVEDGATITGNTGIAVKRGTLNVTGGTITANGTTVNNPVPFTNGTEMTGAAVSLTDTYSDQGAISVNISGGKFVSTKEDSKSLFINGGTYALIPTISVTGGTFETPISVGAVTGEGTFNTKFITGGTFISTAELPVAGVVESTNGHLAAGATIEPTSGVVSKTDISTGFGVNINQQSYPYDGDEHIPDITVGKASTPPSSGIYTFDGDPLVEGVDYEIKWAAGTNYTKAGKKYFDVIGKGGYEGKIADKYYTITGKKINVNVAQRQKIYGDDDPTYAQVEIDASTPMAEGESFDDIREAFLFVRETDEGANKENVGPHNYIVHIDPDFDLNYEVSVLQNHGILYIDKAELVIEAKPASRKFNETEPTAFEYVVDDDLLAQLPAWDKTKATGTPGDGVIKTITRASGTSVGQYAFTATADNYNVTVSNKFTITPATDLTGLKFQFQKEPNSTVYLDGAAYTYTGVAQEPGFKIFDGTYELRPGVDYWATGTEFPPVYDNNIDVTSEATVSVTMIGNYEGTAVGKFAITKAPLTIVALSYTSEQNEYGFEYDGFVNGETAEGQEARNITEPEEEAVTYFKAPTAPVVTKGEEIEAGVFVLEAHKDGAEAKNYEFKTQNGLLALNGTTPITVRATKFTKEYDGQDVTSEDLKDNIEVLDGQNHPILGFDYSKLVLPVSGPIYEIKKAANGHKHNIYWPTVAGSEVATGANEGFYDITLRGATVIQGYTINWQGLENGCEIQYREIELKAADKTKVYGAAVPTLTAAVVAGEEGEDGKIHGGLIAPDTEASIGLVNNGDNGYDVNLPNPPYRYTNQWNIRMTGDGAEHATVYEEDAEGNVITDTRYNITPVLQATNRIYGNYRVTAAAGKLAVTKATVQIAAANATKQFGTPDPEFTITVTPADDGTPASVATVENMAGFWTITRSDKGAADGENVGDHKTLVLTLTEAAASAENFTITASTENGTLTITKAQLIVKANGQWINYGGEINPYDVRITKPATGDQGLEVVLNWNKVTTNNDGTPVPLTEAQTEENNAIIALGHLEVLPGKDQIGTNYDAFKFVVDDDNYEIKPDAEHEGEVLFTNNTLLVYPLEVIPLGKADLAKVVKGKTLSQVLQDHQGCTVTVVLPSDRSMAKNDWYSWVLPFAVTPRMLSKENVWGYAAVDVLDTEKSVGKNVVFKLTVGEIPANTPFLVKVDEAISATQMGAIQIEGVKIAEANYAEGSVSVGTDVQFVGLYEPVDGLTEKDLYLTRKESTNPARAFYVGDDDAKLSQTRAYLHFASEEAAAEARIFVQEADGTTTTINGVEADADAEFAEGWYTVTGVKLTAEPTVSGTYIYNGKKVYFQAK